MSTIGNRVLATLKMDFDSDGKNMGVKHHIKLPKTSNYSVNGKNTGVLRGNLLPYFSQVVLMVIHARKKGLPHQRQPS